MCANVGATHWVALGHSCQRARSWLGQTNREACLDDGWRSGASPDKGEAWSLRGRRQFRAVGVTARTKKCLKGITCVRFTPKMRVYSLNCVTPAQRNFLPRRLRASPLRHLQSEHRVGRKTRHTRIHLRVSDTHLVHARYHLCWVPLIRYGRLHWMGAQVETQ